MGKDKHNESELSGQSDGGSEAVNLDDSKSNLPDKKGDEKKSEVGKDKKKKEKIKYEGKHIISNKSNGPVHVEFLGGKQVTLPKGKHIEVPGNIIVHRKIEPLKNKINIRKV